MSTCTICKAAIVGARCKFDVPIEEAPWMSDYNLIATGAMSHDEHQIMVARWNLHHKNETSAKVLEWAQNIVNQAKE